MKEEYITIKNHNRKMEILALEAVNVKYEK